METQIQANKVDLDTLFTEFWFIIPEYQRSYVWSTDNVQDLMDDLWYAFMNKPEYEYFLGSLVLKKTDEQKFDEYEVLDGQQRLTTFFIMMAVLRDVTTNGDLKTTCQERIFQKENKFRGIPERIKLVYKIRDNVDSFVKEHILSEKGTLSGNILEAENSKNVSIAHMSSAIKTVLKFFNDKEPKEIENFGEFISLRPVFIYVSTQTRQDAFRMFTILNNRGIPLTNADILKSINIGEIEPEKERDNYAKIWEKIEGELGEDFDRFLSFIRTMLVKEKARLSLLDEYEENIYKKVLLRKGKDTINYIQKVKAIYDEIILLSGSASLPNEFNNLVTIMNIGLPSDEWISPLLLFYQKFKAKLLFDFAFKLEFKFSSDWILQLTPTQRIENMNYILKAIDLSANPEAVLNNKELFAVDRESLRNILSDNVYGRRFTRYVLLKYEFLLGDNTVHLSNYKTISVEHVLPQNPDEDSNWTSIFNEDHRSKWTHRLGNLVLISKRKNSSLSNLDFDEKKEKYLKGRIDIFPSGKIFTTYDSWEPHILEERQESIINTLLN